MKSDPVLVTGATGYVGGRLIPALPAAGYRVRAMERNPAKMGCRPWAGHNRLEPVQGDVLDLESLNKAASGCRATYYLGHSMIVQKKNFSTPTAEKPTIWLRRQPRQVNRQVGFSFKIV